MTIQKLRSPGELVAAIATLIYLPLQIRRNTQASGDETPTDGL